MTTTDKKKAILRAIEKIQKGHHEFCCFALEDESHCLRDQFTGLFAPPWRKGDETWSWTFFSDKAGRNDDPLPSKEKQIAIRTTALWFFYHMQ